MNDIPNTTEPTTPGTTPPAVTPPAAPGGSSYAPPASAPATEKTFTQADLDRIVKDRLDRERAKYPDYDALKAAKDKLDQLEAGQLSEQEKLQKQIAKLEQKAAEAEARALEHQRQAQTTLIRSAVVSEAARLGFSNPEDAYLLLATPPTLGEDGQPVGVTEAVTALAQGRPYLLKQGFTQPRTPASEPFNPTGPPGQLKETDDQRRKRLFNKGGQIFDVTEAERRGGGVVWKTKPE